MFLKVIILKPFSFKVVLMRHRSIILSYINTLIRLNFDANQVRMEKSKLNLNRKNLIS